MKYGGDEQPEDMPDAVDGDEDGEDKGEGPAPKEEPNEAPMEVGHATKTTGGKPPDDSGKDKEEAVVDETLEEEDDDDLELKLALLEIYNERYDKRMEAKAFIFDRGLVADYRKVRRLQLASVSTVC
jgi:transcriptional adapter 2-alpha